MPYQVPTEAEIACDLPLRPRLLHATLADHLDARSASRASRIQRVTFDHRHEGDRIGIRATDTFTGPFKLCTEFGQRALKSLKIHNQAKLPGP